MLLVECNESMYKTKLKIKQVRLMVCKSSSEKLVIVSGHGVMYVLAESNYFGKLCSAISNIHVNETNIMNHVFSIYAFSIRKVRHVILTLATAVGFAD